MNTSIQPPMGRRTEAFASRASGEQSQRPQQNPNEVNLKTQIDQLIGCIKADGCETSKSTLQQLAANPEAKRILQQMANNRQDEQTAQIAKEVLSQPLSQRDQAEGVRTMAYA